MTTAPMPTHHHSNLAMTAVALAVLSAALMVVAFTAGGLAGIGMALSLAGFILAVIVWRRQERWAPLWLPLILFPVLLVTSPFWV